MNKDNETIGITTDQLLDGLGQLIRYIIAPPPKHLDTLLVGEYVIVRTASAGVFAGLLNYKDGDEIELLDAQKMWDWTEGSVKNLKDYKLATPVMQIILQNVIEISKFSKAEVEDSAMGKNSLEVQKEVAKDAPKAKLNVSKKPVKKVEPPVKVLAKATFNKKPTRWKDED